MEKMATNKPGSAGVRWSGRKLQEWRSRILRAQPLCTSCERQGRVTAATVVDHLRPLSAGGTYSDDNANPLCVACHTAKSRADRGLRPKGCTDDGQPLDPNHWWNK